MAVPNFGKMDVDRDKKKARKVTVSFGNCEIYKAYDREAQKNNSGIPGLVASVQLTKWPRT